MAQCISFKYDSLIKSKWSVYTALLLCLIGLFKAIKVVSIFQSLLIITEEPNIIIIDNQAKSNSINRVSLKKAFINTAGSDIIHKN